MERRQFIEIVAGGVATVGLAGCSGQSGDGPNVSDEESPGDASETLADETVEVSEDSYQAYTATLESSATLSYDAIVREGPAIDIIVTNGNEFTNYENDENFRYNSAASELDTSNTNNSTELDSGNWALILDNTSRGEAEPPTNFDDDIATVEIEATIS
ncbi:hypothetical protein [Halovenus sp. HT40]|uniref:hypothetical protein n=1 Tax=Halovenus sp. HT40 TaxID=3126691 RepID=UPI00300EB7D0